MVSKLRIIWKQTVDDRRSHGSRDSYYYSDEEEEEEEEEEGANDRSGYDATSSHRKQQHDRSPAPAVAASEWSEYTDPNSGETFEIHTVTKEVRWVDPDAPTPERKPPRKQKHQQPQKQHRQKRRGRDVLYGCVYN